MTETTIPAIKLRADICIDIDASDYLDAGEHQRRLERLTNAIRQEYPQMLIQIRQRRSPSDARPRQRDLVPRTGAMHEYD